MISMTPIEEAWNLNGKSIDQVSPYEKLKSKQTQGENLVIPTDTDTIHAFNDAYAYDDYLIRVESFKPLRIDIAIQDSELIAYMKNLTHAEQQQKATELLLNYYRSNSAQPTTDDVIPINPPHNAPLEKSTPVINHQTSGVEYYKPHQSGIEYYKPQEIEYCKPNQSDDLTLYFMLAVALFILFEKLGRSIQ